MFTKNVRRGTAVALPIAVLAITLIACTAPPPEEDNTAEQEALAAKFVACLTDEGQTAKILEGGMVGLLLPDGVDEGGGMMMSDPPAGGDSQEQTMVMITQDDDGTWQASSNAGGYPEEGGMRDAWTACEEKVPDFEQPEPDLPAARGSRSRWRSSSTPASRSPTARVRTDTRTSPTLMSTASSPSRR